MCDHCGCRDLTPIRRLMDEHDRLREYSGRVALALAGDDVPTAREHFAGLLEVLVGHVTKEEKALFPMLAEVAELADHVAVLEGEHADLFDELDALDDLHGGPAGQEEWVEGVRRILHELGEHMFKEDFGLFPAALATLDGADWDEMDAWEATQIDRANAYGGSGARS